MVVKSTNFLTKLPFRFYTVHYVRVGLDTSSFVNQNKIDAMGRDARKDINRFNELAVTGRVMKAMQNGAGIRVFLGTKQAHIQFGTRNSYEPF